MRTPAGVEFEQYTIEPELINQDIPESDFVIDLPAGTEVHDDRGPTPAPRHNLTHDTTSTALLGGEDGLSIPGMPGNAATGRIWILGGAILVLLLLWIGVRIARHRKSHR